MKKLKRIILLGPPASGKGTQSSHLSKSLGLSVLGTGNLLRQAVEDGTELGKEVKSYIEGGMYVPDSLIESLVKQWVEINQQGWIFDGFPRTKAQAEYIDNESSIGSPDLVIGLEVSRSELERRINSRRQCRKCSLVTNTFVHQGAICPDEDCDGEIYARNDDAIESFRVRYDQYSKLTKPLFDYYDSQGILKRVNGEQIPQCVSETITDILENFSIDNETV